MRRLIGLVSLVTSAGMLYAQSFTNINNVLGINAFVDNNLYGSGVAFVDIDDNGWDDLTFCTDTDIKVYLNFNGTSQAFDPGFQVDDGAKQPTWVDYDNDGDLDFFFTQRGNPVKLYRNEGNMTFTDVTLAAGFPQYNANDSGASWGDYDRDGDLDVYVCTYIYVFGGGNAYDWYNHLYRNNGDGTFSDVSVQANVQDGISLSFQSVWIDYNNDLWPDLYIINDKEHPNRLYHNNGDGTFDEIAQTNGSAITMVDAMTASCGDFNNDGFEDIFVTNTSIGDCALLRNNGDGTFEDIAITANVDLDILGWSGVWMDQDLDSDLDLYVCEYYPLQSGQINPFMKNNGNETFTQAMNVFPFDFSNSYAAASGDWNNDGYFDLAVSNYGPQNANVWRSNGGTKHHARVRLHGVVSNARGVGSRIELWHNGTYQSRQTYCGENYLGQDTYAEMFGLNDDVLLDSLKVHWISGFEDILYNLPADAVYDIYEGMSFKPQLSLSGNEMLCPGDSLQVYLVNAVEGAWNTGLVADTVWLTQPGAYVAEAANDFGFVGVSDTLWIVLDPVDIPVAEVSPVQCPGGSDGAIELFPGDSTWVVQWEAGMEGVQLVELEAGIYQYTIHSGAGCTLTEAVEVGQPDAWDIAMSMDPALCFGTFPLFDTLLVEGATAPYSIDFQQDNTDSLFAGWHQWLITDANGCDTSWSFFVTIPDELEWELIQLECVQGALSIEVAANGGIPPYEWQWSSGDEGPVLSNADTTASYIATLTDANGCTLQTDDFSCPTLTQELYSDFIEVFPVPLVAPETLHVSGVPVDTHIEVCTVDGRKLESEWHTHGNHREWRAEGLSPGLYVLHLSTGNRSVIKRIIIE
ncbi:MAG: VCBS repeat-containing protein [Flavobacteriales bacterium]|nr:VCBS repeat-containing protein [Flavobacteriales bacterium]